MAPAPSPELRFRIDSSGWTEGAVRIPSLHFDLRPDPSDISLIVIHNISLPPCQFGTGCVQRFFTDRLDLGEHPSFSSLRSLRVASHYFVERTGLVTQFLSCDVRGWHAGVSSFFGRTGCNDFSIGIEVEGSDFEPFCPQQYEALNALTEAIASRYPIRAIAGHSDIAPGRKTDPGPYFQWEKVMTPGLLGRGIRFPFASSHPIPPEIKTIRA